MTQVSNIAAAASHTGFICRVHLLLSWHAPEPPPPPRPAYPPRRRSGRASARAAYSITSSALPERPIASLSRPTENVTGASFLNGTLGPKRPLSGPAEQSGHCSLVNLERRY